MRKRTIARLEVDPDPGGGPGDCSQSWPARQDHRGRSAGRVRQRHRRASLCERGAAADGSPTTTVFPWRNGSIIGSASTSARSSIGDDGDIVGDGVNIAARFEALADAGGICVSARVQEDVAGKLDLVFEDMGEHTLKNIARPVRLYRVLPDATAAKATISPVTDPSGWLCPTSLRSPSWRSPT